MNSGQLEIIYGDLLGDISGLCEGMDAVIHAGAKTFVDHSIRDPGPFFESNTIGTYRLLEEAKRQKVKRYIQVSTDEVYGSILSGAYKEDAPINPTNPYSASKAAADAIVTSYAHTFGLHTTITRTENNYGHYQHPQKAIPTFVRALIRGEKIPLYGNGLQRRQWLWVDDHVSALLLLLKSDHKSGEIFHVANNQEITNLALARSIIAQVISPNLSEEEINKHIASVPDRPGHDQRYALDSSKLKALGWKPQVDFETGLKAVVRWLKDNPEWLF